MTANSEPLPALERPASVSVLVVDDEESARALCCDVARDAGLRARSAATTEEALEVLERYPVDIVISDLRVPKLGGLELLKRIRENNPQAAVMMLTQYGTIDGALEATRLGAADYLTKPFRMAELRAKLDRLVHSLEIDQENRVLKEQLRTRPGFGGLIGVSLKMQQVYRLMQKVSEHNYPVLILGESGTGKEVVARSIHFAGPRHNKPFVPVDCSALTPTLIESELFGYVKGAFTGAVQNKQGLLEAADSGTLFLDEIGDLPLDLQAKLLRALQEHEIKPVGSTEQIKFAARVMAATNRDLDSAVRSGAFRQDLYFRLNVVQIKLPALRERKTDIALLVTAFLEKYNALHGRNCTLSEDVFTRLMAYDWPGNIRELEHVIERAVALSSGPILHLADLPTSLQYGTGQRLIEKEDTLALDELERRAIFRALKEAAGDKLAAARLLGIGKTTLYRKLKQYQLQPSPHN
ncbi:MAG: sigma-54 dependent transcriptional regulator [Candidatus Acidiferrales bacterium]